MKVVLALVPVWESLTPPLSLAFLKSSLMKAGHEVRCIDFSTQFRSIMVSALGDKASEDSVNKNPEVYKNWAKQICDGRPDVVGFSLLVSNIRNTALVASEVRKLLPGVMIVSGGPSLTRENMGNIRQAFTFSDYLIEGEGEATFVEFLKCLEAKDDFNKLKQIWIKNVNDSVYYTGAGPLQNIDTIPWPDFSDFDRNTYICPDRLPMLFSRGCILNCNYCENKWNHLSQRSRSGRLVFEELKWNVAHHGIREYMFNDDSLISYKTFKELEEYCDLAIAEGLTLPWSVYGTRVERKLTEPYVKKLRLSGMNRVALGVESFSSKIQHEMGKSSLYDDADKTCRLFANQGIKTESWIIYGYPTETDADFNDTLNWFIKNPKLLSHVTANSFGPNAKYLHDKPGIVEWGHHGIWDWQGPESTIEKRKKRFLALIEVLESIRRSGSGRFTYYFGDPCYVKYFSSWTKEDQDFLFEKWAKLEVMPEPGIPQKHSVAVIAKKKKELSGDPEEMRERLFGQIEKYLSISLELNELERKQKLEMYKNAILRIYSLASSRISAQQFYTNALVDDMHIIISDLDAYTPEELSKRIPEPEEIGAGVQDMSYELEKL